MFKDIIHNHQSAITEALTGNSNLARCYLQTLCYLALPYLDKEIAADKFIRAAVKSEDIEPLVSLFRSQLLQSVKTSLQEAVAIAESNA